MKVIIIGGGAAGCFAAIKISQNYPHTDITILEAGSQLLQKVRISGGGRCNLTHACFNAQQLAQNYPRGQKELIGVFSKFGPKEIIQYFESKGVPTKTEKDGRIFPESNKSESIIQCLTDELTKLNIKIKMQTRVKSIEFTQGHFNISTNVNSEPIKADKLLITSGGILPSMSQILTHLGHRIVEPLPSLFSFKINPHPLKDLSGTSITQANSKIKIKKKIFQNLGDVLITHEGFSGPGILKLSAFAAKELHNQDYKCQLNFKFFPESNEDQLYSELQSWKNKVSDKSLASHAPWAHMIKRLWIKLLTLNNIDASRKRLTFTNKEIRKVIQTMQNLTFEIVGKSTNKSEFVTCGGVSRKEVSFQTMQSKITPGLFFAGEVLDIDAVTGGFNFQNAWSTAWLAAEHIGKT